MIAKKWVEELGKFLLDVGKYVVTAVVISSILGSKTDSWQWLVIAVLFTIAMVALGLMLINATDSSRVNAPTRRYGTSRNRNNK